MRPFMNPAASEIDPGGLQIKFWGTRGSMPRPGPETLRYGGNTTCVEVRLGDRVFIIDAGSGIEAAGRSMLDRRPLEFDILFSHLHHDHIAGLPFFPPALNAAATISTHCGNLEGASAEAAFDKMFAPPLFPVTLSVLPGQFIHKGFQSGSPLIFPDGIVVETCPLPHPGGSTAYRFDHGGKSMCYISDVEHTPGVIDPSLVRFCEGADLVIYDTMFTDQEFQACRGWGHSTLGAGVALCRASGARALVGTHHHMRHTDVMLDGIDAELRTLLPGSFMAREGMTVRLGHEPAIRQPSSRKRMVQGRSA